MKIPTRAPMAKPWPTVAPKLSPELAHIVALYKAARIAPTTRRVYRSALKSWARWCQANGVRPWPPTAEVVEGYCADLAQRDYSMATIQLALAALTESVRLAASDQFGDAKGSAMAQTFRRSVRDVLAGIRNTHGTAPRREARPLLARDLVQAVGTMGASSHRGVRRADWAAARVRERAYLLLAWSCAHRRGEVVGLELRDVAHDGAGWIVHIRRSKTDQQGKGAKVRVECIEPHEVCAACALAAWLEIRPEKGARCKRCKGEGCPRCPLFGVSDRTIARSVQRAAKRLGFDPKEFAGHSLRSGLITSAYFAKVGIPEIMKVSRHASAAMVGRYIRGAELLGGKTPAGQAFGALPTRRVTSGGPIGPDSAEAVKD